MRPTPTDSSFFRIRSCTHPSVPPDLPACDGSQTAVVPHEPREALQVVCPEACGIGRRPGPADYRSPPIPSSTKGVCFLDPEHAMRDRPNSLHLDGTNGTRMAEVRGAIVGIAMAAVLAAATAGAAERVVQLDPDNDLIGQQIYAVQTYTPTAGGSPILDIGLYDTGASVISFSAYSNPYFPQPHLNPGGAGGQGVGGSVVGDVSQPGSILAGGILDFLFDFNLETFEFSFGTLTDEARAVPGIQVFVGTEDGSPSLPSLTGTPIHKPSAAFPAGSAAHVTMQGFDSANRHSATISQPMSNLGSASSSVPGRKKRFLPKSGTGADFAIGTGSAFQ
jgi:hypothetical protein